MSQTAPSLRITGGLARLAWGVEIGRPTKSRSRARARSRPFTHRRTGASPPLYRGTPPRQAQNWADYSLHDSLTLTLSQTCANWRTASSARLHTDASRDARQPPSTPGASMRYKIMVHDWWAARSRKPTATVAVQVGDSPAMCALKGGCARSSEAWSARNT
eukprot:scaffold62536_cov30-Tisochrysis_lutea.AAC.1